MPPAHLKLPDCARTRPHHKTRSRATLAKVWQLHRQTKNYILLTVIATVVDLAIGVGGVVSVIYEQYMPALIVATWTMRCATSSYCCCGCCCLRHTGS